MTATETNVSKVSIVAKAVRSKLNELGRSLTLKGVEKANASVFAVLADSVRDAGNEPLAEVLNGVARLMPAIQEHRRAVWGYDTCTIHGSDRNKFIAIDMGSESGTCGSGLYLVEKATGYVWSIKAYGKKNRVVAVSCDAFRETLEANTAQYDRRKKAGEDI